MSAAEADPSPIPKRTVVADPPCGETSDRMAPVIDVVAALRAAKELVSLLRDLRRRTGAVVAAR